MPLVIMNDTRDVLFREEKTLTAQELLSPRIVEEEMKLELGFGKAVFKELYFDGLHIAFGNAQVFENLHVAMDEPEGPSLVSQHFVLQGNYTGNLPGKPDFHFSKLEHNLLYNPTLSENAKIKKQDLIEVVSLSLTRERFLELAENNGRVMGRLGEQVAGNKIVLLNQQRNQPITMQMLRVLEEIRSCRFAGGIKKLFLQSKALELLALQCEQYERSGQEDMPADTVFSAGDREKIYHARDLLLLAIQQPPSLRELSRQVGLNEFKLKSGFKKAFDNTVFGYLNNQRLDQARELLLQQPQRPLCEIALELGYSSPQHFSNAFSKRFGISPGRMRR